MFLNDDKKANNYYRFRNLFRKCLAPPFSKLNPADVAYPNQKSFIFFSRKKSVCQCSHCNRRFGLNSKKRGLTYLSPADNSFIKLQFFNNLFEWETFLLVILQGDFTKISTSTRCVSLYLADRQLWRPPVVAKNVSSKLEEHS